MRSNGARKDEKESKYSRHLIVCIGGREEKEGEGKERRKEGCEEKVEN